MPMRPLVSPSSLATPERRAAAKATPAGHRNTTPFHIVAVDDEPDYVDVLREALAKDGASVADTTDEEEVIHRVADGVANVVLLDVPMPRVDGFATRRRLRRLPEARGLPIFMLAADDPDAHRQRAFACGASDCLHKISALPELLAKIRVYREIAALQQQLTEENQRLRHEMQVRSDLERVLVNSLDRALLLVKPRGEILFQTQLATTLLFKHLPKHRNGHLPGDAEMARTPLRLRRFREQEGNGDISMLLLEEQRPEPGPKDLIPLGPTPREAEVLFWISQGKTNPEIALIIGAARRTVATHVEHLLAKLEVENRACAALMAVDRLRPAIGA
ncbi:MAG: response regulator [Opitutaceae bacterium]